MSATLEATPETDPDFDWDDPEAVVLREQPETAVYRNSVGALVIRQRGHYPEEDSFIFIAATNVDSFLDKLTDIAGL